MASSIDWITRWINYDAPLIWLTTIIIRSAPCLQYTGCYLSRRDVWGFELGVRCQLAGEPGAVESGSRDIELMAIDQGAVLLLSGYHIV
jgi:hypothetical protein